MIRCMCEEVEVILELVNRINRRTIIMAGTIQDLKDAIAPLQAAIDADVAQDEKVVEAINALLKKIEELNVPLPDLQPEIDALKAATAKLSSDNAAVQAAIDTAVPPSNPA